jgi:hypothetical protein
VSDGFQPTIAGRAVPVGDEQYESTRRVRLKVVGRASRRTARGAGAVRDLVVAMAQAHTAYYDRPQAAEPGPCHPPVARGTTAVAKPSVARLRIVAGLDP